MAKLPQSLALLVLFALCVSGQTPLTATLSQARFYLAGASALDTVAVFAGGETGQIYSNMLDVYRSSSGTWSALTLSTARSRLCAVGSSTDQHVYLAGGLGPSSTSNVVDIYNTGSDSLLTSTLSAARSDLGCAWAGNLVLFAGGQASSNFAVDVVDVLDVSTGIWSISSLSAARWGLASASTATKAIFAGGKDAAAATTAVDIFDLPTASWSVTTLSSPRWALSAAAVGSRLYVLGGADTTGQPSAVIDVLDLPPTGSVNSSTFTLTTARYEGSAVANAPTGAVLYGGGVTASLVASADLSVYVAPDVLFPATLALARSRLASACVGNTLLFAGGWQPSSNTSYALVDLVQVGLATSPPPATTPAASPPPSSTAPSPTPSASPTPSSLPQTTSPSPSSTTPTSSTAPSSPPPTSSTSPCPCCQPPNAICDPVLLVWVLPSVANSAVLLLPSGSIINGTFTQAASGTLQLTSLSSAPALRVSGCASLSGALELTVPQPVSSSSPTNITAITSDSSCVQGQFSSVTVYSAPGPGLSSSCSPRALSQSISPDGGSLLVLVSGGCGPGGGLGAGAIAGIVIAVLVVVAVVAALLVYKFSSLRYRLRGDADGAGNDYIISTTEKQHPL